ncbi:acyl-CoA dehydrogenase family protein [Georgenia sp. SYP-B2076]|uniref:acyl-CoA dehydrogenase family protein n=1 Tax=Georgenia sp. SYP-B2076 TaxID=2495881 RepID=UPI000F8F0078|nr:acyl-CoA dehydrogenase family protein [Georgenia sp. SYP-B2076]
MTYTLTADQQDMRTVVADVLAKRSGSADVRRVIAGPEDVDEAVWRALAVELGLAAVLVPEDAGGLGLGWAEVAVVQIELGRSLACVPYFASGVVATHVLTRVDRDGVHRDLLEAMAAGSLTATLALRGPDTRSWSVDGTGVAATTRGGGVGVLTGEALFVQHGASADVLLVSAADEQGLGLYRVESSQAGLTRTPLPTLDATQPQARLTFEGVEGTRVGDGDVRGPLTEALGRAQIALAAEHVGVGRACVEMTIDHVTHREQFGQPIGAFQAVKHRLADAFCGVEAADAAVRLAAEQADLDATDAALCAAVAVAAASSAMLTAAAECVQLHGAMGFTEESDAHLYLKRAKTSAQLLGAPAQHRSTVSALSGL